MKKCKLLFSIFFILILAFHLQAQEYYYVNGEKRYFTKQIDQYVIQFHESSEVIDKKNFLTTYNIISQGGDVHYSNYILCNLSNLDEDRASAFESHTLVNKIFNFYKLDKKNSKFAPLDKIILGLHKEDSALLNQFIEQYNLIKTERKWLGQYVYELKLSSLSDESSLSIELPIMES
jgi:hypothetical protein